MFSTVMPRYSATTTVWAAATCAVTSATTAFFSSRFRLKVLPPSQLRSVARLCPRGAPAGGLDRKILLGNAICVGSDVRKQRMKVITHLQPPAIKSLRMPTVFDNPSVKRMADGPKFRSGHTFRRVLQYIYALTLAWSTRTPTPMVLDTDRRLK